MRLRELAKRIDQLSKTAEEAAPGAPWVAQTNIEVVHGTYTDMQGLYANLHLPRNGANAEAVGAGILQVTDAEVQRIRIGYRSHDHLANLGVSVSLYNLTTGRGTQVYSNVDEMGGPDEVNEAPLYGFVTAPLTRNNNARVAEDNDLSAVNAEFTEDPEAPGHLIVAPGIFIVTHSAYGAAVFPPSE